MKDLREAEQKMKLALDHLRHELTNIRTNRANPGILDSVTLEVYGTSMRLKDVANVTAPESRQLMISPFDPSNLAAIAKGIEKANIGLQPIADGNVVRINIPAMNKEVREEMSKQCKRKGEEAKVSIRNVRREAMEMLKKQKADGHIPEDQVKKHEKEIQNMTDRYCKDADDLTVKKEHEVMEI